MNDFKGKLAKKTIELAWHKTHLSGKLVHSCAEATHFHGAGDMIFDSDPKATKKYGIPKLPCGWSPYTQLMSDHLPVSAIKKFHKFHHHHHIPHFSDENKRKVDAMDRSETELRSPSSALGPREVAVVNDVDPHESAPGVQQEWGPLCCKRARRQ